MNVSGILRNNYGISNQMNYYKTAIAKSNEKLSTRKRINSASDSPADMLRISKFNSQVRGSQVAQRNIQDGISMLQTADVSLGNATEMGQRLKELSVQYNNETLSVEDKSLIEQEAKELTKGLQDTLKNTKYNEIEVFDKKKYKHSNRGKHF